MTNQIPTTNDKMPKNQYDTEEKDPIVSIESKRIKPYL